jgi:Tol biopolymer transport system component
MSHRPVLLIAALAVAGAAVLAQAGPRPAVSPAPQASSPQSLSPEDRWLRAFDAWESGRYPAALEDLRVLMRSPAASEYLERVALLTGELYVTTVLTDNGANPRISGNGAYASYQTTINKIAHTIVVRVSPKPQVVADLQTLTVAFDAAGRRLAWLRQAPGSEAAAAELIVRDLTTGADRVWLGPGMTKIALAWSADDRSVVFTGLQPGVTDRNDVYSVTEGQTPVLLTTEPGLKTGVLLDRSGRTIVYQETAARGGGPAAPGTGGGRGAGGGQGRGGRGGGAPPTYGIVSLADKTTTKVSGTGLALSADGSTVAWLARAADGSTTLNMAPASGGSPVAVRQVPAGQQISALDLSPDGRWVAYQLMTHTDWEIYISDPSGTHRRLTRDIQHDLSPRFLSATKMLGLMGEARHRRSQIYDLETGTRQRLFANNTIRTISPEYTWVPSVNGTHVIIQADRDGDTVSTERHVAVVDLTRKVTVADVLARIDQQLAHENDLRQRMTAAFKPIADLVRRVVGEASEHRVYAYEKTLVDFDSKYITQPGNLKAIEYLEKMYRSFGYQPELQWFVPTQLKASGGRTANVVATLRGTEHPHLIYVVSSHFDSVAVGPGADDDTSGTAALLEAARILSRTPLPATVVFASFTGEEAGLLGSREFVRLAAENKWQVVGALNNDMIGWAADSARIDNTIRFSNAGIRDIQHGAAFQFTDLVLFDAKYYRSTDAAAFYEAWGDIVGGIGSYPVLANPNYHQSTDFIETMSFKQITETAKVTAATLIYLASSPSRLKEVTATRTGGGVNLTWTPSPETGVTSYVVAYGPATDPLRTRVRVTSARATLPTIPAGTHVAVKAINARGLEGWDWARIVVQ